MSRRVSALADWLRDLRDGIGYTQQEMADWVGVHRVTFSRWETGATYPPYAHRMTLNDIARKVGHEAIPRRWEG